MVCAHCGTQTAAADATCPSCGWPAADADATAVPHAASEDTQIPDAGEITQIPDAGEITQIPDAGEITHVPVDAATVPPPPAPRRTISAAPLNGAPRPAGRTGAAGPLDVGQAFGARYHIIKVLGVGGMGAVYQAWDAELSVAVAVKVIRPEIASDPISAREIERRFKRELLLARQVTHPNVVRIHDLGEIDGIKYITMPFVDGSDLATVLKRHTRLEAARALKIARGIVSGLVAAHAANIVHRDLKPANVMIGEDDEPTIMDFGIARSSGRDAAAAGSGAAPADLSRPGLHSGGTVVGAIIGTIEYMAPEQAKGEAVDQRADIYAFGLILYDMLIGGRRSERAESAIAELQGRMKAAPPAPRTLDRHIPEAIDAIIVRCLQPDASLRFQTTTELQSAFERLDERGKPLPIIRRLTRRTVAAAALVVSLLLGGTFYVTRQLSAPPVVHDPVTVVIADVQNTTDDPTFGATVGQTLRRALEDASFITAIDRSRIRSTFGVAPPETFDKVAARELAVKQGLGVVLAGSIASRGSGYDIAVEATQPLTGDVMTSAAGRASSKDQILPAVARVVADVRTALGDPTSDSAQLLAMKSLSTTSLDVASQYAAAVDAQSRGNFEGALEKFAKAVELDPKFGLGYQGMAVMSRNLGRLQDAEKYAKEALRYLDAMTERERFATRASYYIRASDYQQCVKEYGELIARFPADIVAHNQRALCLSRLRDTRGAVDEMRKVVQLLPNHTVLRTNLAVALNYASDFTGAEQELAALKEPDARAVMAAALSKLGQGQIADAAESYKKLSTINAWGKAFATAGLADIAVYEGRFADAARLFNEGATADLAAKHRDGAAMKLTALAYAYLAAGDPKRAAAAADSALTHSNVVPIRFLTARVFVETGDVARARTLADGLSAELPAEPHAYGKIIEGEIALESGDPRTAIKTLTDANAVLDTWIGRFDLGRAYLAAKAYPQADSEFDRCVQRRGEALALVDEDPTYSFFPMVYYYQGRVREELQTAGFADAYRAYLDIRGRSTEDPLVRDIRKRIGA